MNPTPTGLPQRRPLKPYEFKFCTWLAYQSSRMPRQTQLEMLEQLRSEAGEDTEKKLKLRDLTNLKQSAAFKEYFQRLRSSATEAAKTIIENGFKRAAEAHIQGLEMAIDAGDYRAVPPFTTPLIDRVMPKNAEGAGSPAVAIQINLSEKRLEAIEAPAPDVEFEVLEDSE